MYLHRCSWCECVFDLTPDLQFPDLQLKTGDLCPICRKGWLRETKKKEKTDE